MSIDSEVRPEATGAVAEPPPGWFRVAAIGSATAVSAGVTLAVAARGGAPFGFDVAVRDLVDAYPSEFGQRLAGGFTLLGGGPVLYPVLLLLSLLNAAARRRARELLPLLALVAGQVLELVLFTTLHRPAPAGGASILPTTTYSSGHTAAAVLGWGLIVWQASRLRRSGHPAVRPLWVVALGIGVVVGATRVHLGLHWLSDAVAGLATGAVLLAVALAALARLAAGAGGPGGPGRMDLRGLLLPPTQPAPDGSPDGEPGTGVPARVWRWLRTSPWAWGVPAVALLLPLGGMLAESPGERMKDLLVYHGAAGWAGAGQNVYAFRTEFAMPFTYPPFAALVMEPLSRMPLGLVQALWTAATAAGVVALAATALRPVAYRIGLPLTVAALLISAPIRSHFRFGQVGVFLVLLVALDLLRRGDRLGRGREGGWSLGWGLGLATAIKLTPAVFLPWLLITRQWRRLGGTLLWIVGATLAGLVLLWPSSGAYLRSASTDTSRFGLNDIPGNQSVRGMLLRTLPDPTAERVWLMVAIALVGIGLYQAWRCERVGNRLAAVGVLAALSVAASPISWVHHLIWLALPIAALAAAGRFRLVTVWFVILVVGLPFLGHGLATTLPYVSVLIMNLQGLTAVAAVLLLPALVRLPAPALMPPSAPAPQPSGSSTG